MRPGNIGFETILAGCIEEGLALSRVRGHHHQFNGDNHFLCFAEGDTLTKVGIRQFCDYQAIGKDHRQRLVAVDRGEALDELHLAIYRCMGLVDSAGALTVEGRFKMIEGLPLSQQVALLQCEFRQSTFPKKDSTSTETYVMQKYQQEGLWCCHDEGGTIQSLLRFALLSDVGRLKDMMASQPYRRDGKEFALAFSPMTLCDHVQEGHLTYRPEIKAGLLALLGETTTQRIMDGYATWSAKADELSHLVPRQAIDIVPILRLFDTLGVERLVQFAELRMDHDDYIRGWPDLMVIDDRQIDLIEVKLNDKLSYMQLRTIDLLMREKTNLFRSIAVERVTLQKP